MAEPVGVVGHQHGSPPAVLVAARPTPAQIEFVAGRAEDVGHRVQDGADLRVAIALVLHRLGVEPERDVVDEHPPVDLAQIDPALTAVDERVQGTDDVVAVDAEIEREVVAGAGRDAGVRQPELGSDRGDDRLRAVPPAMANPSAPRATAARTSVSRSSPRLSSTASMPRLPASLASAKRSALPPPDFGL